MSQKKSKQKNEELRIREEAEGGKAEAKTADEETLKEEIRKETIREEAEAAIKEREALKKELEGKKKEIVEYIDTLQRLKAEFENYKKRMVREQTQFLDSAAQGLVTKLLPVLDNFELALYAAEGTKDHEKLTKGIEMAYGEFKDVLYKEGLRDIEAEGRQFDPTVHEAVMQIHSDTHTDNAIVDVLRQGYLFRGRVLRPTLVKVAKK